MTREPEMVKAYRDTWELGLHSYLTYLRDRLLVARELLTPSGSVFVQIGDENLHHVRELLDEVFGAENFVADDRVRQDDVQVDRATSTLARTYGLHALVRARHRDALKFRQLFTREELGRSRGERTRVELPTATSTPIASSRGWRSIAADGARLHSRQI